MVRYASPREAAKQFGISTRTLRSLALTGRLPQGAILATPSGQMRYDLDALRSVLQEAAAQQIHEEAANA